MIIRAAARSVSLARYCPVRSMSPIALRPREIPKGLPPRTPSSRASQIRSYASISDADEKIEIIQELYATTRDEFEIAAEETEKKTVYAADDRAAAQEELKKLKDAYDKALEESTPDVSAEIKSRVGQRIRELDHAIQGVEEAAKAD